MTRTLLALGVAGILALAVFVGVGLYGYHANSLDAERRARQAAESEVDSLRQDFDEAVAAARRAAAIGEETAATLAEAMAALGHLQETNDTKTLQQALEAMRVERDALARRLDGSNQEFLIRTLEADRKQLRDENATLRHELERLREER